MRRWPMLTRSAALSALALSGCGGVGFDPPDQVKTLRVLAVQKSPPYQAPGGEVTLRMLYWDGKAEEGAPRDVSIAFADCVNPPADLYYGCFDRSRLIGGGPPEPPPSEPAADADHVAVHKFRLPPDIISSRPPAPDGTPSYGLGYVLFGVCAGTLADATSTGNTALPLACVGADGAARGAEDFVPGYTSIYAYEDGRANSNPVVNGFTFRSAGTAVEPDENGVRHVPRCVNEPCPGFELKLDIDHASAEPDPGASDLDGRPVSEQLWVSYYRTAGDFSKAQRLVNDATRGWSEDNATSWSSPKSAGPARVWGVVHDNRGGVEWVEVKLSVD